MISEILNFIVNHLFSLGLIVLLILFGIKFKEWLKERTGEQHNESNF